MIRSIWSNFKFELTSRKKFVAPYVYGFVIFAFMFFIVCSAGGAFKGVNITFGLGQKVFVNSPYAINLYYGLMSIFGVLIIAPIFGQAVCKDYEAKFDQIVLSAPVSRTGFYLGRFFGSTLVCTLIFLGLGIGHALASAMPFVQRSLFTAPSLNSYLLPYLTLIIPNIIIFGSISFAVGTISKKMSSVYITSILSFMGYLFASTLTRDIEKKTLRALADPFGVNALGRLTEYWSVAEKNSRLLSLTGPLLWNRVLWLGVSLVFLGVALVYAQRDRKVKIKSEKKNIVHSALSRKASVDFSTCMSFDLRSRLKLFWSQVLFEAKGSVKNIYFLCLTFAGILFVFFLSGQSGKIFGTETYPITYKILETTSGSFGTFLLIIIIFYTGELIWRDRQSRLNQIIDAMPLPTWIMGLAKFAALQLIIIALLSIVGLCGILIQTAEGYTHYELVQVFRTLFTLEWPHYFIFSSLVFAIHTLVNDKVYGHGFSVICLIGLIFLPSMGFDHVLYVFGAGDSHVEYSDMNGYGPFLARIRALQLYWGLAAGILLNVVYLFWFRGVDDNWSVRVSEAKARFVGPARFVLYVLALGFIAQGSYVFYNTNVVNEYHLPSQNEKNQLYYETTFKHDYDQKPQLSIVAVHADVDLYPKKLKVAANFVYTFENKTSGAVGEIFIKLPVRKKYVSFAFDREAKLDRDDVQVDVQIYRFTSPVHVGETVSLVYKVDYGYQGFQNDETATALAGNGTFINNSSYFPTFGYDERGELSSDKLRAQYGLKPKARVASINDVNARRWNYLTGHDADWIDFETTVSTDSDQIAIAPGYLQKEWVDGDRHFFHYKMDEKILNFYSYLSARYEVARDHWNDVKIEIYYNKGHEYNLASMMEASKQGLSYFTENFGPYQSKQFRIVEFPRYNTFAQSFPNTVPFSEAIGFIAKVDPKNPKDLDYPYYVTAHELAHQWWGHQVVGANVQGATLLSETLAQYSALMVMEKKFGREKMERFLSEERDGYLVARSQEEKTEQPLVMNENQQYIHYNKGSIVMFALKEEIGEKSLNAAIRKFLESYRYQKPPYVTSLDFVATLKANIDPKFHDLIDDMLTKITFYDNRIEDHTVKSEADGTYAVELKILGRKLYVDEHGDEIDAKMNQEFEISAKDKDDKLIFAKRYPLVSGTNSITIRTKEKPQSISLDALGIWIDRNRGDNKVTL
ncbi:MAG: hypothetical protein H7249_03125 [Chitinophagaceae bacterium]|nr:hypothetical protein [Oligoflexus sp.]